ncbi:hypothetical protein [Nonomuraea sp. NPDC046570]|uniref:hypothetical protein n=1 Tax=Nonomuraea sp. NPDC046570 TaxID=3155255 RepID=UPI00340A5CE4
MTEPSYLTLLRASYDTVAVDYAKLYGDALASMPLTRAMLAAFAEFHRTLAPGGHLLLGTHVGDEYRHLQHAYGHPVSIGVHRLPPARIAELLAEARLAVTAQLLEEPGEGQERQHACLVARKTV